MYNWPKWGGWPLLIALLPWVIRLIGAQVPFQPTRFDWVLVLFLLTAWVGIWASYDQLMSLGKYWLIVNAVFLYFALAGQPRENLWIVAGLLGIFGTLVAGYFLLTHDWAAQPAKFESINQAGLWLMSIRPGLNTHQLHPNVAGGIIAMLTPFSVAVGCYFWRGRRVIAALLALAAGTLMAFSLLLSTSRGAWIALSAAMGIWFVWGVSGFAAGTKRQELKGPIFFSLMAVLVILGIVFVAIYPGGALALLNRLPGPANAGSRVDLMQGALDLAGDFPFTGGGLGAFPALYSQYIRVIPNFFIIHAHNLILDVAVEQGVFGALALALILLGCGWLFAPLIWEDVEFRKESLLYWGALAGLLVMSFHGLFDDPLYGSRGVMLLFLPVGLSVAVTRRQGGDLGTKDASASRRHVRFRLAVFASVLVFAIILYYFRQPILAGWYADLGAVTMARVELAGWPTGKWEDGSRVAALEPAEVYFSQALAIDLHQRTALHRLGLIAMSRRDFDAAVAYLDIAFQMAPQNQGIRKTLGYSEVWTGQYQRAAELLADIPEAGSELSVYVWWWGTQGRKDLSDRAAQMVGRLKDQ
ncbi:MAG: O-antigen ligase family protein [Chloroflexi bacterium]|nr:O-antigen ligase family protein [Chloroflexota bacterium]